MRKLIDWTIFAVVCLGVFVLAGPVTLGGSTSYVIVDGESMEPTYATGDLVIAREQATYELGDVITYDAPVGQTFRVIHRITEITGSGYVTRGDNRNEDDGWVVPFDAVHGSSALHVPYGGVILTLFRQPAILIGLAAGWLTLTLLSRRENGAAERRPLGDGDDSPDQEPRRNRSAQLTTIVLFAGMVILGSGTGFIVANAASLVVRAGTLQVWTVDGTAVEMPAAEDQTTATSGAGPVDAEAVPDSRDATEPTSRTTRGDALDGPMPEPSRSVRERQTESSVGDPPTSRDRDQIDDAWTWTFPGDAGLETSASEVQ